MCNHHALPHIRVPSEHRFNLPQLYTETPNFHLLIDPDYKFTNSWHLRWDAPRETAYPSTFVINKDRVITFAKISKTHGDRADVKDVMKVLKP